MLFRFIVASFALFTSPSLRALYRQVGLVEALPDEEGCAVGFPISNHFPQPRPGHGRVVLVLKLSALLHIPQTVD